MPFAAPWAQVLSAIEQICARDCALPVKRSSMVTVSTDLKLLDETRCETGDVTFSIYETVSYLREKHRDRNLSDFKVQALNSIKNFEWSGSVDETKRNLIKVEENLQRLHLSLPLSQIAEEMVSIKKEIDDLGTQKEKNHKLCATQRRKALQTFSSSRMAVLESKLEMQQADLDMFEAKILEQVYG